MLVLAFAPHAADELMSPGRCAVACAAVLAAAALAAAGWRLAVNDIVPQLVAGVPSAVAPSVAPVPVAGALVFVPDIHVSFRGVPWATFRLAAAVQLALATAATATIHLYGQDRNYTRVQQLHEGASSFGNPRDNAGGARE